MHKGIPGYRILDKSRPSLYLNTLVYKMGLISTQPNTREMGSSASFAIPKL